MGCMTGKTLSLHNRLSDLSDLYLGDYSSMGVTFALKITTLTYKIETKRLMCIVPLGGSVYPKNGTSTYGHVGEIKLKMDRCYGCHDMGKLFGGN